jgi:hypothetical protein
MQDYALVGVTRALEEGTFSFLSVDMFILPGRCVMLNVRALAHTPAKLEAGPTAAPDAI